MGFIFLNCNIAVSSRMPPFHRSRSAITELSQDLEGPPLPLGDPARVSLLRPPSVVVSDHDLCAHGGEEVYLTLEDLERQSQYQHRRRLSDASTCSSFSELDFQLGPPPEEDTDGDEPGKVRTPLLLLTIGQFLGCAMCHAVRANSVSSSFLGLWLHSYCVTGNRNNTIAHKYTQKYKYMHPA